MWGLLILAMAAASLLALINFNGWGRVASLLATPADPAVQTFWLVGSVVESSVWTLACVAAWSNCRLGSALARLLCLTRARLAVLGGSRHPGRELGPLGAQPLPRGLEPATTKVADFTAFDHPGVVSTVAWSMIFRANRDGPAALRWYAGARR